MEKILADFGVQPVLLAAQAVNFLVLLFILNKLLYKPVLKVLNERKKRVEEGLKSAEEADKKLAQTEEDRVKKLEKASTEARKILDEATVSANQIIAEAHERAQRDIEVMVKKGQQSISLEHERMQEEFRGEVAQIITASLERVLGTIKGPEQKKLINEAVKNI